MKIDLIAGARPNFMKVAPIIHAIQKQQEQGAEIHFRLVHTGQHYDKNMSQSFFEQLNIPDPDVNLGSGGGTQAEQTARIMTAYESLLLEAPTDLCLVVGDVTSTMACAITAKKLAIAVAHVEAGIRSGDRSMPEEINRLLTDSITDYFFITSLFAKENLLNEGVSESQIYFVGNTMIDTLLANIDRLQKPAIWNEAGLKAKNYIVITMHRPANVDEVENFKKIFEEIIAYSKDSLLLFPVHPRTAKTLKDAGIQDKRLITTEPMSYLEFNYLVKHALAVVTDSGGITEETTVMGIPCMTLRDNTERPETISEGTNELLGTNPAAIKPALDKLFQADWKKGTVPELWDGKTAERIVKILMELDKEVVGLN